MITMPGDIVGFRHEVEPGAWLKKDGAVARRSKGGSFTLTRLPHVAVWLPGRKR